MYVVKFLSEVMSDKWSAGKTWRGMTIQLQKVKIKPYVNGVSFGEQN